MMFVGEGMARRIPRRVLGTRLTTVFNAAPGRTPGTDYTDYMDLTDDPD
jgi:hypothetical protein